MAEDTKESGILVLTEDDEINIVLKGLAELFRQYRTALDPYQFLEHVSIVLNFEEILRNGTSDPDNFFTITEIEALFKDFHERLFDADFRNLLTKMVNLKGEAAIIKKKRGNTSKKE
ncbi:MAG: hypothetical protein LBE38_01750 [Deltaproteobacteria bacterium]|jgi:hypothetical protein|nr:hypothetical protein [Deltaproteobacteria bacterium]